MLKRLLKRLAIIVTLLLITLAVISVAVYIFITRIPAVSAVANIDGLPLNTWTRINLSDQTQCSDGSDYRIYAFQGESPNLLIHFAGGGMAWDARSASKPITITDFNGFYFPNIWEIVRATLDGISNHTNPENPFAHWSQVYIPYCTGDFHIGDTSITYPLDNGQSLTIHHNGRQNVTEALDWVYANFDQPPKLVVSGESAGAFGSTFWVPTIASHYTTSDTYHLSDGAFLRAPNWEAIVNAVWKAESLARYGFTPAENLINSAYLRDLPSDVPHITYLQFNTLYDAVLTYFDSVLNAAVYDAAYIELWSQAMRASMAEVAASTLDYNYYLTDYGFDSNAKTTPHTSISAALFYQIEQDDARLVDWVRRIVIDGERYSIGAGFLP